LVAGATKDEILQVVALTIPTRGFPAAVAAFSWIEGVLAAES
jgi:alkylhydroperoxidase/carboxymuconolactone decarboxylase family protein YurZ